MRVVDDVDVLWELFCLVVGVCCPDVFFVVVVVVWLNVVLDACYKLFFGSMLMEFVLFGDVSEFDD